MRLTYDAEADAAYVYLTDVIHDGEVATTTDLPTGSDEFAINADFGADGKVLGLEILGASHALRPEVLRDAT